MIGIENVYEGISQLFPYVLVLCVSFIGLLMWSDRKGKRVK